MDNIEVIFERHKFGLIDGYRFEVRSGTKDNFITRFNKFYSNPLDYDLIKRDIYNASLTRDFLRDNSDKIVDEMLSYRIANIFTS